MKPLLLPANTPPQFYRGGRYLAELWGTRLPDRYRPEDWVASPVPRFGESSIGLTVLTDGRTLVDALAADPEAWLGPAHVAEYGAHPALLVKLLDAGERLPVHCHRVLDLDGTRRGQWDYGKVSGCRVRLVRKC
jgi:mannose-6-phosphate isomerase